MNLANDPWIPAVRQDGTRELFSLQQLFANAHELRDLAVKPHERIALMRLLVCITQAALDGPADEEAWEQCEPLIQPRVRTYLETWRDAFELFGEGRRFIQIKPGVVASATPVMEHEAVTRLNLSMASGDSNSTLFDNSASDEREFTVSELALSLVTYQCYSPLLGRGYKGRSPCADSSMLHTFLIGQSLLRTLRFNILTKVIIADNYPRGFGRPIWEISISGKSSQEVQQLLTQSYLGRLVPMARSIWLETLSYMTLSNALIYDGFKDAGYREASATVIATKTNLVLLSANSDYAIWRQLPAITVKRRAGADMLSGPLALGHDHSSKDVALWIGALITDQAKIEDVVEAYYDLPSQLFTDFGRAAYEHGVKYAEENEASLTQAVKTYATLLKIAKPAYDRARQHFWTRIEQNLSSLFDVARRLTPPDQLESSDWGRAVRAAALDAYEQSCPRQTPRQIQAFALGLRRLNSITKLAKTKANKHE